MKEQAIRTTVDIPASLYRKLPPADWAQWFFVESVGGFLSSGIRKRGGFEACHI